MVALEGKVEGRTRGSERKRRRRMNEGKGE
jgi:hypothetical protein